MKKRVLRLLVTFTLGGTTLGALNRAVAQNPSVEGQWGPILNWSLKTTDMVGLKNGKVMCTDDTLLFFTKCILFDPADDSTSNVFDGPTTPEYGAHFLKCSGHVALYDGRILFTGGFWQGSGHDQRATIFDPDKVSGWPTVVCNSCWSAQDESPARRYYPTLTTLADGTVLHTAGHGDPTDTTANTPAIFDATKPVNWQWRLLAGAEYCDPQLSCLGPPDGPYNFHIHTYPFMFLLSDRRVLYAGQDENPHGHVIKSRTLDPVRQTWTDLSANPDPLRGGSAVMYAPDKVIKAGGDDSVQIIASAAELNLTGSNTEWAWINSMANARTDFYLIVLPDGKILAVGGKNASGGVLIPELYDPANPGWTSMAAMQYEREQHSTAILLTDGRVLIAGGDSAPNIGKNAQIFSPPYLFQGTRPTIDSDPPVIDCGTCTLDVSQVPDAVSLIRLGSATHGFDQDQRFVPLNIVGSSSGRGGASVTVEAPESPNVAPPGYYMLSVVASGVPSEAKIVQVDLNPANSLCDDPTPPDPPGPFGVCTFDLYNCPDASCSNVPALYGDTVGADASCGPNDVVDLKDIIAVSDAFGSVYNYPCELHNHDVAGELGGCMPNGSIDLYDTLAVQDAFGSVDPCCCPTCSQSGGSGESAGSGGEALIILVPRQEVATAGRAVRDRRLCRGRERSSWVSVGHGDRPDRGRQRHARSRLC